MLNLCITADHELFSGKNYASEEDIVVRPTYALLKVLEQFKIPLCLMTDVCSLIRYRALNIESPYVHLMEEQLRYAITRGHDVQLHIHPHWLTSEFLNGQWSYKYSDFRLHSFGFGETGHNGRQIIAEGKKYLDDLLKPLNDGYECIAFRAGGWCLQPEKEFLQALVEAGILIDTTVYYGGFFKEESRFFDFRRVPNKPNWWIDPQRGLEYEACQAPGNLFEVAIGSYGFLPLLFFKKLMLRPYRLRARSKVVRELGGSLDSLERRNDWQGLINRIQRLIVQPIVFNFDPACVEVMMTLLKYYLKHFDCINQEYYISIIGHPKVLNEASLVEIGKFCKIVTEDYSEVVRFIRLRDIPII